MDSTAALTSTRGVEAKVDVVNDAVTATVHDPRADIVAFFQTLDDDGRARLATEAWRIGLQALRNAYAQAEEARLKDVGQELMGALREHLARHVEDQEKSVTALLQTYFDPRDGKLTERLQQFIRDDGELARIMKQYLAPEGSVMAATLARSVGETSPLFKRLSPTDSEGVIRQMEGKLRDALEQNRETVAKALDPLVPETPVRRFLDELHERLKAAGDDQHKQLKELTQALDANNEESLLNRLNRDVQRANRQLIQAINPDDPQSPMAIIRNTLSTLIEKHMEENKELLEKAEERQAKFQAEVTKALARLAQQKEDNARSTHGGFDFEDAVTTFLEHAVRGGPYHVQATGATTGSIRGSKVGDQVVRFAAEHAFGGSGLVVEAKRSNQYTVPQALAELEEARKNRDCQAGLFVMAASHAPKGFPPFARYGPDVLVTWDPEKPESDAYLHAALLTGLALVTRSQKTSDAGDIAALHDIEERVRSEIDRLDKMKKYVDNILRDATHIDDEVRKAKGKLDVLIRKGTEVLKALDVEVHEEAVERAAPITAPLGSFAAAQGAVRSASTEFPVAAAGFRARADADDELLLDEEE